MSGEEGKAFVEDTKGEAFAQFRSSTNFILRSFAFIYCVSFYSIYVQFPGLFGWDGLEPVNPYVETRRKGYLDPSLVVHHQKLGLDPESTTELCCLTGCALAFLVALRVPGFNHFVSYLTLWYLYYSVYRVGQVWLGFQWDILLLEAGFVVIWLAPVFPRCPRATSSRPFDTTRTPVLWALRFVLFKLMLLSGLAKIDSNDSAWLKLTALEYHFASQCIPTPLAWWFSNLSPLFLKVGVLFTFVVELNFAILILVPCRSVRHTTAFAQIALQVIIALTGNYGFFNWMTAVMCCSLIDDSAWPGSSANIDTPAMDMARPVALKTRGKSLNSDDEEQMPLIQTSFVPRTVHPVTTRSAFAQTAQSVSRVAACHKMPPLLRVVCWLLLCLYLAISCHQLFAVHHHDGWNVEFKISSQAVIALVKLVAVPAIWAFVYIFCVVNIGMVLSTRGVGRVLRGLGRSMISFVIIAGSIVPLYQEWSDGEVVLKDHLPQIVIASHTLLNRYDICNSYGLFRVMTGKGKSTFVHGHEIAQVARPEIEIQFRRHAKNYAYVSHHEPWQTLEFLYKPTDPNRRPPWVAPHQPRLDWQMWFAALEDSPFRSPWLLRLVAKLLQRSPDVMGLFGWDKDLPFLMKPRPVNGKEGERLDIRMRLFNYNFTRVGEGLASPVWWNRSLADGKYSGAFSSVKELSEYLQQNDLGTALFKHERQKQKRMHDCCGCKRSSATPTGNRLCVYLRTVRTNISLVSGLVVLIACLHLLRRYVTSDDSESEHIPIKIE